MKRSTKQLEVWLRPLVVFQVLVLLAVTFSCQFAWAYTPESAEVRAMVKRAVKFLSKEELYDVHNEAYRALGAMAIYKAGEPETHPIVAQSLKELLDICRTAKTVDQVFDDIYELSVVGIFLCEVDAKRYEKEIANVIKVLEQRQKPFGGWGYKKPFTNWEFGDTSMTQYAVLCAWLSKSVGAAEISKKSINDVAYWLVRTQDVSGSWGYQGRDPGEATFTKRIPQSEVRPSLGVAGLGSLYICSGMLGLTPDIDSYSENDPSLPKALKPVSLDSTAKTPAGKRVTATGANERLVKAAIRAGNKWFKNSPQIPKEHALYYLYTLERYQSFKEIAENRNPKEPGWYNRGVSFLKRNQKRKGEWDTEFGEGKIADTAFGVFFLVRGTKRTIQKAKEEYAGRLVAGQGLPSNASDIRMKQGKVVSTPFQGTADSLLEILSDASHPDFDSVTQLEAIPLSRSSNARAQQQKRMQRLVHAESYQARLVAVKTLSKLRDLDNVPTLIYALSDPDQRVVKEARDALRFTGRKFGGFGLSDSPSDLEVEEAVKAWKKWYRDIRPDSVFVEN